MENFECPICNTKYDDPIECLNCNNNFCRSHVPKFNNICPYCKICPFKFRDNIWLSRTIEKVETYQCSLCELEGDKISFWSHLIENHKEEIIQRYNKKNSIHNSKAPIENHNNNGNPFNQNLSEFPSQNNNGNFNKNISINNNNSNCYHNYSQIPTQNQNSSIPPMTQRNFNRGNNQFQQGSRIYNNPSQTQRNSKYSYCGNINELIKCSCCPDHICKPGNCLCVKCMKYNIEKYNLGKEVLINRAGRIAKPIKGTYFCGIEYDSIIKNAVGIKFEKHSQCQYPAQPCNDCKVLSKFKNIYLNKKNDI